MTEIPLGKFIGKIEGPEPEDEAQHFIVCGECGQAIDCRDLGEVFHHEDEGHLPIKRDRA